MSVEKKYASLGSITRLIENIKAKYALLSHKHTKSDITDFPKIPSKVSELENDSGYKVTDNNTTYTITKSGHTVSLNPSSGTGTSVDLSGYTTDDEFNDHRNNADMHFTADERTKLAGIADGANKYIHPSSAGNKHIPSGGEAGQILRWSAAGTAVWGADNNTTYVAAGTDLGLVKSGGDVTISGGTITVNDDSHNHTVANVDGLQSKLDSIDDSVATKVPTGRTVNGKALTGNISLSASDVGADASGSAATALTNAKKYTDDSIKTLIGSSPENLDTIYELGDAITTNQDAVKAVKNAITNKVDKTTTVNGHALSGNVTVTKSDVGLGSVENKSSATIRSEITKENVTTALGYTPPKQDTTYDSAGSNLGLVKTGGDVTISSGVITVNDDSHAHVISNVDGLQGKLDSIDDVIAGKSDSGHTHNYAGSSSAGGAATSLAGFRNTTNSGVAPDSFLTNGIGYITGASSIFGTNDAAMYAQAYSNTWVAQIAQDYNTGSLAVRGKKNNVWQNWRHVVDSVNYKTYLTDMETKADSDSKLANKSDVGHGHVMADVTDATEITSEEVISLFTKNS